MRSPRPFTRQAAAGSILLLMALTPMTVPLAEVRVDEVSSQVQFISGKSVGLKPPPGFVPAVNFAGFKHAENGSAFVAIEHPPQFYPHLKAAMMKDGAAPKGVEVEKVAPFVVNGVAGFVLTGTQSVQDKHLKIRMLVLGGKSATVMLTAQSLPGAELSDATVMAAFQSVRFRDPPGLQAQLESLPFSLGNLAGFRVWRTVAGNMVLLTKDLEATRKPLVTVMRIPCSYPQDTSPAKFAELAFREFKSFQIDKLDEATETVVAGARGYEAAASGRDTRRNVPVKVGLWFRYEVGHLLAVMVIAQPLEHEALLADLRTLASGIRIK